MVFALMQRSHLGIDPAELPLVVLDELHGLRLEVSESRRLSKGRHFKGQVLFLSVVEALTLKMSLVGGTYIKMIVGKQM